MTLFGQWWFGWSPWQLNLNSKENIPGRYPPHGPDSICAGIRQAFLSTMAFNGQGGWQGNNRVSDVSLWRVCCSIAYPRCSLLRVLSWHEQGIYRFLSPQAICTGIWWGEVICRWFIAVPKEVFISGSSRSTRSQTLCGMSLMIETSGLAFYNTIAWKTQKKQFSKDYLTRCAIQVYLSLPSNYIYCSWLFT